MKILDQAKRMSLRGSLNEEIKRVNQEEVKALTSKDLQILHDIMVTPHVGLALYTLQNAGFFDYLIPEIKESIELKSSKQFKLIWPHTIKVVNQTPPKLSLRWAALFHDLGKAQAFDIKKGKVTFHNHENISSKIFGRFAKKSRIFSRGLRRCVHFLVSNLGYVEGYENNWTDSAVRRFDKQMGIYLDDLLALSRADITTANDKKRERIYRQLDSLKERVQEIRNKDENQKEVLPKGLGTIIAKRFDLPKGPKIGCIRKTLESEIQNGNLKSNEDYEYYIKWLNLAIQEQNPKVKELLNT